MDSDDEFVFLASALYCRTIKKRKRKQRLWIHPIISERENKGFFYTLYNEINQDPEIFFNFSRMSQTSFQELLAIVKEPISRRNTVMRKSIPAEEKLKMSLKVINKDIINIVMNIIMNSCKL